MDPLLLFQTKKSKNDVNKHGRVPRRNVEFERRLFNTPPVHKVSLLFTGTCRPSFGEVCVYVRGKRCSCVRGVVCPLGSWQKKKKKKVPLPQWLCCSRPVCFQNSQGEAVRLRPGIRENQHPIRPAFSFNKHFLPLLTCTFPSHI